MASPALRSHRANLSVSTIGGLKYLQAKLNKANPAPRLIGWALPIIDLNWFINQTHTDESMTTATATFPHANSVALAYQLANMYGVAFLLSVGICYSTTEPNVLRSYIFCLALGDVGHCYATYLAIGREAFLDIAGWNLLTRGNFGVSTCFIVSRVMYQLGAFGDAKASKGYGKKIV